jgi:peptidoglycan/LPS O-acetylase OafA/YrhL
VPNRSCASTIQLPIRPKLLELWGLREQIPSFDGIRALAFLAVFAVHARSAITSHSWLFNAASKMMTFGWMGVDLFFVLSGFLITGGLISTERRPGFFTSFYRKRTLRIFPLYYFATAILLITSPIWAHIHKPISPHQVWYLLYLQNWIDPFTPFKYLGAEGHLWSLAIEEQFYLAWPLCVYFARSTQAMLRMCVVGIGIALLFRLVLNPFPQIEDVAYKFTFARMDALLAGAMAVIIVKRLNVPTKVVQWLLPASLGILTFICAFCLTSNQAHNTSRFMQSIGYTLNAVAFACLLIWLYETRYQMHSINRFLSGKFLRMVGRYSYGLYVYHAPLMGAVGYLFARAGKGPGSAGTAWGVVWALTCFGISFAVAAWSFKYLETPFLRLKNEKWTMGVTSVVARRDSIMARIQSQKRSVTN